MARTADRIAPAGKLGIIAGGGTLPARIKDGCLGQGRPVYVAALNGHCQPDTVAGADHHWFDIAAIGHIVGGLRAAKCAEIVFAGPVGRPDIGSLRPDWEGVKLLPRVLAAATRGDDAIVKVLVGYLEEQGFRVVGAEACLDSLLVPSGCLTRRRPDENDLADAARAVTIAAGLGALDVGQAAVVRDSIVLGVEAVEGTDALLARCAALAPPGPGGVLAKWPKPGQERRVDLPTIGTTTVENAAAARLHGIVFESGGTLILDREAVVARADALGIFLLSRAP